jgi:hypothetical protein
MRARRLTTDPTGQRGGGKWASARGREKANGPTQAKPAHTGNIFPFLFLIYFQVPNFKIQTMFKFLF